jgi:hypothetical protein
MDLKKYNVKLLERCTRRVLYKLFASAQSVSCCPELSRLRGKIYAWHYSVLAKSYLKHDRPWQSCRLVFDVLRSHPSGLRYLLGGAPDW